MLQEDKPQLPGADTWAVLRNPTAKPKKSKPKSSPTSPPAPRPTTSSPQPATEPAPVERHITYRMEWAPLGKLILAAIVLFIGIVFGTQIELWVHADHAPHPLYVAVLVGVVWFYIAKTGIEAAQAFACAPGHPPKLRREVVYATSFRARFARVWRLIIALVVVLVCLASTGYAWPDVRNVGQTIYDYVRKNRPLEEPKKHTPQRSKTPDPYFFDDPLGWLRENTKPAPGQTETWPPKGAF